MKKAAACILSVSLLLPLCGCWDMQELNTRMFLMGIGIDLADDGYAFTFCSVEGGDFCTVTINAPALPKAVRELEEINSNRLDLEHLACVIIGQSAADSDFRVLLDYVFISPAVRRQCHIAAAKGSAQELLTSLEGDASLAVSNVLEGYDSSRSGKQLVSANSLFISLENNDGYFFYELEVYEGEPMVSGIISYGSSGGKAEFTPEDAELALLFVNGQTKGLIECAEINGSTSYYSVTSSHCIRRVGRKGSGINYYYEIDLSVVLVQTEEEHPKDTVEQEISRQLQIRLLELAKKSAESGGEVLFMQSDTRAMQSEWYEINRKAFDRFMSSAPIEVKVNCTLEGTWVSK